MSSAPCLSIDPPAFWRDPYPDLARMRAEAPIAYVPELGATLITRRDEAHLADPVRFDLALTNAATVQFGGWAFRGALAMPARWTA